LPQFCVRVIFSHFSQPIFKMQISQVLKDAEWVVNRSSHCHVASKESIHAAARKVIDSGIQTYSFANWKAFSLHPQAEACQATAEFIFLLDLLNFSFWSHEGEEPFTVQGYTGYQSLCALIQRALSEGIPLTSASWMSKASRSDLLHVFRSDTRTTIPLIEERIQAIQQAGRVLVEVCYLNNK
jgi:hypothetical protein